MLRLHSAGPGTGPARATHTLVYGLLRRNPAVVLALGGNLELLGCSRAAEDLLGEGTFLRVRAGRLLPHDGDDAPLRKAMSCLEQHPVRVVRFSLRAGGSPVQALIEKCSADGLLTDAARVPERVFLLWLQCQPAQRPVSPESLREIYALTACEAEVAAQVYAGRSIPQAAAQLAVSVNTVKSHLKNVFQKCDVRSQSQLIKLVALGAWLDWRARPPRKPHPTG